MYYSLRYPTTCNVNFQFPFDTFQPNEMSQIQRAVEITAAALQFKHLIDTETLEPDRSGNVTDSKGEEFMDMESFRWMFEANREPRPVEDLSVKHSGSSHIAVAFRNRFFTVPVALGPALDRAQLQAQLQWILENGFACLFNPLLLCSSLAP